MEASGRAISAHARLLNSGRNADLIRPEENTRLILFADTVLTPAGVTWSPRGPPGRDKIDHPREAHDVGIALSQQARRSRLWQIERIMASWPDRPAGSTRLSDAPPRECNFAHSRRCCRNWGRLIPNRPPSSKPFHLPILPKPSGIIFPNFQLASVQACARSTIGTGSGENGARLHGWRG